MSAHPPERLLWWCNVLLRLAGWIVPRRKRKDWRRGWEMEIWHWCQFLVESGRLDRVSELELLKHCWGAFEDALWHRFNREVVLRLVREIPRSPRFCLIACLALLAGVACWRPSAVYLNTIAPAQYADARDVWNVEVSEKSWLKPEVLADLAEKWSGQAQHVESYAVYAWRPSMVRGPGGTENLVSARVTPEIFELLGARPILGRVFQQSDASECGNCVVLSDLLWRSQFHRDPNAVGQSLVLNGRAVHVIGVMPLRFRFPGRDVALYSLFEPNAHPALPRYEWPGALLRVASGIEPETAPRELRALVRGDASVPQDTQFQIMTLREIEKQSLKSWAGLIVFALALLLVLKLGLLARVRMKGPHATVRDRVRWYVFFWGKAAILVAASLVAALEIADMVVTRSNSVNAYALANAAAVWAFLFGTHLSLTWAIRDQLGRCRVCLSRLGVRVNLGNAGRLLLDVTGDELVCDQGHGALHLPVMESSCVDTEHWTYLDESWQVLLERRDEGIRAPE